MDAFVALDAGTGAGKCVIFDRHGKIIGAHREPWSYELRVHPELPFIKEFSFSAPAFWQTLCGCARTALAEAGLTPSDVVGIAATSQREGCVFLDAHGTEIYAGPNIDARGFREGLEVLEVLGAQRLYQITGHSAPFIFPLARYLWCRANGTTPVAHVLMISDWITYRLSGELCAEPSNATESMLFDLQARCWSEEILSAFRIPAAVLPVVRQPGERVGALSAAAAAATGLNTGTPIFVGGADTQCSLLGAGTTESGATAAILGTTTPVQTVTAQATFDPQANLWAGCHVVPGRWVLESNSGETGGAYLWLLDLVSGGLPREELYRLGDQLAAHGAGAGTMMFVGPTVFNIMKMRFNRPGAMLFPFPALHVRPDRAAFVRAFMESVGYTLRANLEQLTAVTGREPADFTLSGGMTRSGVLTGIVADVIGLPVGVAEEAESAALGCAILIAANDNRDGLTAATRAMVRHKHIKPDADTHERYVVPYAKWRELYDALDELELA